MHGEGFATASLPIAEDAAYMKLTIVSLHSVPDDLLSKLIKDLLISA
jgi:hypothetical protein